MSHVDDGALHAYLDGALDALPAAEAARIREHLAACDACARRLEEERALRAEARAILRGADPELGGFPSLEELRALATVGGVRPSAAVRLRRLGWAASIVVAVGAGWMLRGVRDPAGPLGRGVPAVAPAEQRLEAPHDEAADAATAPPSESATRQAAGPAPASPVAEVEREDAPEEGLRAAEERSAAEEAPLAPAPTLAMDELVVAGVPVPDSAAAPADSAVTGRSAAMAALQDSLMARLGEAKLAPTADRSALRPEAAPPAPPAAQRASRVRADVARSQEELARRRVDPAAEVRTAEVVSPTPRFVYDALGPVVVPGLPLIAGEQAPAGLPEGTLRVLHRVEADTLEILRLPPGVDPSSLTLPEGDGRTQVSVRRGDGWLVGRARLSSARIAELLAQVPGGR